MTKGETVRIGLERWSRDFDPGLSPTASAKSGDKIIVQTYCCAKGSVIRSVSTAPDAFYDELAYTPGMPVTGPIDIHGAQVGDVLKVDVLDIQVADQGWTMALRGRGAIGHRIETGESRLLPVEDGEVVFLDRARLPARPMIGSIGTTPAQGPWSAGNPGLHGGNMDCRLLGTGTTIFLPVFVPGAQLALGDLHAIEGNGETGCAAGATERMAGFLAEQAGISLADTAMLLSLAGDLSICQIVNPTMTCRIEVSKVVLAQLGIDLASLWQRCEV